MGGNTQPTHFSFFLPLRFHLKTVRLKADFIISVAVVDIRIRAHTIGGMLTARRATRPQIRRSLPSLDCLGCLLVKTAAGISAPASGTFTTWCASWSVFIYRSDKSSTGYPSVSFSDGSSSSATGVYESSGSKIIFATSTWRCAEFLASAAASSSSDISTYFFALPPTGYHSKLSPNSANSVRRDPSPHCDLINLVFCWMVDRVIGVTERLYHDRRTVLDGCSLTFTLIGKWRIHHHFSK